ncbi:unnamed protein product [Orchesella dallaii]|uniref:Uncharacterized protein n=1 Tax=Orchesella dallaii TaxID=48710 RepID=A0ABP1QW28_9HEXA
MCVFREYTEKVVPFMFIIPTSSCKNHNYIQDVPGRLEELCDSHNLEMEVVIEGYQESNHRAYDITYVFVRSTLKGLPSRSTQTSIQNSKILHIGTRIHFPDQKYKMRRI